MKVISKYDQDFLNQENQALSLKLKICFENYLRASNIIFKI